MNTAAGPTPGEGSFQDSPAEMGRAEQRRLEQVRSGPEVVQGGDDERWFYKVWHWLSEAGVTDSAYEARAAALTLGSPAAVWRLLREMPVGLVVYDAEFRIVYQNPAGELMTGYPNQDYTGQSPVGLWMLDDEPALVAEHLRRMREDRVALRGRSVHLKKDGSRAWVQWFTTPLFDDERFVGYLGVHTSLGEEARAARQQAELLIDAATDIAFIQLSPQGRIENWMRNAVQMFGRAAHQTLGQPLAELFDREGRIQGIAEALLARSAAGVRAEHEGWLMRQDHSRFWAHLRVYPQVDDDGATVAHTALIRDLTERIESERALGQYREQLSALTRDLMEAEQKTNRRLAQLLHDQLGQTFTSLRLFVDALQAQRRPDEAPAQQAVWGEVSALIDRGMHEVRQVLDDLRPVLLEEHGLAVALDNEAQAQALAHPLVDIDFVAPPAVAQRRWPADAEYAAFMIGREALANALKHSGCSHVTIMLEANGAEGFQLRVRDDGAGLAETDHAARPGHLGLVGMRERALGLGARLQVSNGPDGQGTEISLRYAE